MPSIWKIHLVAKKQLDQEPQEHIPSRILQYAQASLQAQSFEFKQTNDDCCPVVGLMPQKSDIHNSLTPSSNLPAPSPNCIILLECTLT